LFDYNIKVTQTLLTLKGVGMHNLTKKYINIELKTEKPLF